MKNLILIALIASLASMSFSHVANATQAQPVPVPEDQSLTPQVEIAGSGAATLGTGKTGLNFSDSALLIGAAQRLYDGNSIGSVGLGWLTLDETNKGLSTQLFLHQAFLDFQGEKFEAVIGRTDNPTAHIVDFPTIRGDDLITLLNPLNPFSNGNNPEEHRYSNVVSVTLNQEFKYFENFHVQHLINSANIGTDTGINSFGAAFGYLASPGMEPFTRAPSFGFGFEHFMVDTHANGLHQIYAGGVINLNTSVTDRWDLRIQDIAGFGSTLKTLSSVNDTFQANSNAIAASIRYLNSPFGRPGYQVSLTGAYKNYFDIKNASSFGGVLTGVKRLGQGFDLVAQYQGLARETILAGVQSDSHRFEQVFELGFVFSFDSTINQHLAPRRSMLNQLYQYVPN